jgi:hypothetical protein
VPAAPLEWRTYEVAARPLAVGLEAAAPVTVELPDLTAFPTALEKARILLESAAEIEHMLMVQYLYAAYSLKDAEEVTDPAQQAALDQGSPDSWPRTLLGIAREEMGHLLTVENLLLALGLPPNLEREDFPPRKDLYPFPLHLERLSRTSLAKYVVAEAPADAVGIEDIVATAEAAAGGAINRVGTIYGLLGVVFSALGQAGSSGSPQWDEHVRMLADAAHQQSPAETWHLPDGAIRGETAAQQGDPDDWQVDALRAHRVADRAAALAAIRDIAEQGEGATDAPDSHFARLLGIYRGRDGVAGFPAGGDWVPTREVPTDPQPGPGWTALADMRYALLLGLVEHYLLAAGDDRTLLAAWIFAEMRSRLGFIARRLTTMPAGAGVAAAPFTLPAELHLPATEPERWALHGERTEKAIALVEEIQAAGGADPYLTALLASDRARLASLGAHSTTSFARDIGPLFRPVDVQHMTDFGLDLGDYAVVRDSADAILKRLRSSGPRRMPPPPDQRWTPVQTALFERWIADGFPA